MALTTASQSEADRLRADTGTTSTSLPDASVDDIWTEAEAAYSDGASVIAYSRVIVLRRMLVGAITINDYRQNETEEKAGAIFGRIEKALKFWLDTLAAAEILAAGSAARFGKTKYMPTRIREYPGL